MSDEKLSGSSKNMLSRPQILRLVSLIENIHQKDFLTMERGRAVYDIFLTKGVTLKSKELAKTINNARIKKSRNVRLERTQKFLLKICKEINVLMVNKKMNPISKSQVEEIVAELSTKCYQTGITVKIVSDPFLVASMNPRTKELKIGQWLLDELPESQLRGILGHEISHLALKAYSTPKSLKLKAMILLAAIIVICSFIAVCFIDKMIWLFIVFPLIIVVIVMVIVFMGFYIPIKDELNADLLAVTLTGDPHSLLFVVESLLVKMKEKAKKRPKTLLTVIRTILSYICYPRAKLELKLRKEQQSNDLQAHPNL